MTTKRKSAAGSTSRSMRLLDDLRAQLVEASGWVIRPGTGKVRVVLEFTNGARADACYEILGKIRESSNATLTGPKQPGKGSP